MSDLIIAGLLLVTVGFAFVMISLFRGSRGAKTEVKGGGVVMIGPIPIVFGSDAKWAGVAIALAIILMLVYLIGVIW